MQKKYKPLRQWLILCCCLIWSISVFADIEIVNTTPESAAGAADGSIIVRAVGSAGPFTMTLEGVSGDATGYMDIKTHTGLVTFSGLASGDYELTVENKYGCGVMFDANIPACYEDLSINTTVDNAGCDTGGSIRVLSTSGGSSPYTYTWSNGDTGAFIQDLESGNYTVTIIDAEGCENTQTIEVLSEGLELVDFVYPSCEGQNNGRIEVGAFIPGHPNGNFTYSWNTGAAISVIDNLSSGEYCVTVSSVEFDCSTQQCFLVSEIPDDIELELEEDIEFTCPGENEGRIAVSTVNGVEPFSFLWENGSSDRGRFNLPAGTYSLTVTDYCSNTVIATYEVGEYPPVQVTATIRNSCTRDQSDLQVGSIDLTPTSGTPPYTYNWSNESQTKDLFNLNAGNYTVTVTDANGCIFERTYSVGNGVLQCLSDFNDCRYEDCLCDGRLVIDDNFVGTYRDLDFQDCAFYTDYCILTGEPYERFVANAPLCLEEGCFECKLYIKCENGAIYQTISGVAKSEIVSGFHVQLGWICGNLSWCEFDLGFPEPYIYFTDVEDGLDVAIIEAGDSGLCNNEVFCFSEQIYDSPTLDSCGLKFTHFENYICTSNSECFALNGDGLDLLLQDTSFTASMTTEAKLALESAVNCAPNVILDEFSYLNGYYRAVHSIETTGLASEESTVALQAGQKIHFQPGFHAAPNSYVHASIQEADDCDDSNDFQEEEVLERQPEASPPPPQSTTLRCFPNPFQHSTTVEYELPEATMVDISLYGLRGQKTAQILPPQRQTAGQYQLTYQAENIPTGMYYLVLRAGKEVKTEKLVIMSNE